MKNLKIAKQRGVVLIVTLIMIVAMLLVSSSLYSSISSTNAVSTNIAMKQTSLLAAEKGLDEAVTWLNANTANLNGNILASGYYAYAPDIPAASGANTFVDFTGTQTTQTTDDVAWNGSGAVGYSAKKLNTTINGFNVSYIIHRLCTIVGNYSTTSNISCATSAASQSTGSGDYTESGEYGAYKLSGTTRILYRVTVRTWLPNSNSSSSYVQTNVFIDI